MFENLGVDVEGLGGVEAKLLLGGGQGLSSQGRTMHLTGVLLLGAKSNCCAHLQNFNKQTNKQKTNKRNPL